MICARSLSFAAGKRKLVDSIDRERMAYVKHYFNAEWPSRMLYHMMINTVIGDNNVIESVLSTMRVLEHNASVMPAVR